MHFICKSSFNRVIKSNNNLIIIIHLSLSIRFHSQNQYDLPRITTLISFLICLFPVLLFIGSISDYDFLFLIVLTWPSFSFFLDLGLLYYLRILLNVKTQKINKFVNTPEGRSTRKVHKKGINIGYIINIDDYRIYHTGDTDFISEMKKLGKIDVALLPIGGTFTMYVDEAVKAALAIKPEIVIPMHFKKKGSSKEFKKKVEDQSDIEVKLIIRNWRNL